MNEKLLNKKNSLLVLSTKLGQHVDDIPFMYPDEVFTNYLTRNLAKQALNLKVDDFTKLRLHSVCNIPFNKDGRTAEEYAIDLIYGWFVEDLMLEFLLGKGFKVTKTGADKDRDFLPAGKIKTDMDLEITYNGNTKSYDIYFDSQGYWNKTDRIDFRESKWKALEKHNAGVICVSNFGFALLDTNCEYTFGPNGAWGGKNCATVKGIKDKLVDIDVFLKQLKGNIID